MASSDLDFKGVKLIMDPAGSANWKQELEEGHGNWRVFTTYRLIKRIMRINRCLLACSLTNTLIQRFNIN